MAEHGKKVLLPPHPPPLQEKPPSTALSLPREKKEQGAGEGGHRVKREWSPGKNTLRTPKPAPQTSQQGLPSQSPAGWWGGKDESDTLTGNPPLARGEVLRSVCPVMNKYRTIHIPILKFSDSTDSLRSTVDSQRAQIRLSTFLRQIGIAGLHTDNTSH